MTTTSTPAARRATIVHPGDGDVVRAFGNEIVFKLAGEQTGDTLSLGLATAPAGHPGPPPHVHDGEDELFIILEGQYRFAVEGEWSEAGPGSVVYLPRGVEHTYHVVGDVAGRHWVITTSGAFASFYTRCGEVFAADGPPDFGRLFAIAQAHGMRFAAPAGGPPR
jgi:quercetin dioxygenase-like cupin family protein